MLQKITYIVYIFERNNIINYAYFDIRKTVCNLETYTRALNILENVWRRIETQYQVIFGNLLKK